MGFPGRSRPRHWRLPRSKDDSPSSRSWTLSLGPRKRSGSQGIEWKPTPRCRRSSHSRPDSPLFKRGNRMDPQCTWRTLLTACQSQDWPVVKEPAVWLLFWLEKGGFPPTLDDLDEAQVRLIVQMVCLRALVSAP